MIGGSHEGNPLFLGVQIHDKTTNKWCVLYDSILLLLFLLPLMLECVSGPVLLFLEQVLSPVKATPPLFSNKDGSWLSKMAQLPMTQSGSLRLVSI